MIEKTEIWIVQTKMACSRTSASVQVFRTKREATDEALHIVPEKRARLMRMLETKNDNYAVLYPNPERQTCHPQPGPCGIPWVTVSRGWMR